MNNFLLIAEFTLLGAGTLVSWNALLSTLDWFHQQFPNTNMGFWIPFCKYLPSIIIQPLVSWKGNYFSYNFRVGTSILTITACLILLPIIVQCSKEPYKLGITMICLILTGSFGTISQTTLQGLAGTMPKSYTTYFLFGQGLAGIIISTLRLVFLLVFQDVQNSLFISTIVYYSVAAVVILFSLFALFRIMKNLYVIQCVSPSLLYFAREKLLDQHELGFAPFSWIYLFKKIWQYYLLVVIVYIGTFGVLTRVSIRTSPEQLSYPAFVSSMILVFNVFDSVGKFLCSLKQVQKFALWTGVILRFGFWILFFSYATGSPELPGFMQNLGFKFLNQAVFALTHGYFNSVCMVHAPDAVPSHMRDKAGSVMVNAVYVGIVLGVILSSFLL